ncbi:hypothetical protein LguiB_032419 [Lonicera macranthoides]
MAAELVSAATSEKLIDLDLMKSIQICELVASDHRQARDVIKAIKKRVGSKNSNTQLFAVMLLEMLMNNIGEPIHKQVIDTGLLPVLVKIVKKKSDLPVREKIFLLLDATQTSLGGASGQFPQYYSAYYDLVSAGVQFPQRPRPASNTTTTFIGHKNSSPNGELTSSGHERNASKTVPKIVSESSIIQKAAAALEVLRDVLDAVDTKHPEAAKDEFTLDLVEQCSFQKQRIMHLAMTSRDDKLVSRAIELNEQLEKLLARHNVLISGCSTSASNRFDQEEVEEEEEAEQLFRRMRKGKGCARAEEELDEDGEILVVRPSGLQLEERLHRPLIRPVSVHAAAAKHTEEQAREEEADVDNTCRAVSGGSIAIPPPPGGLVVIPPPPAKHVERERFFQVNKSGGEDALAGHVRGLSLHSRSASSSSHCGSLNSND